MESVSFIKTISAGAPSLSVPAPFKPVAMNLWEKQEIIPDIQTAVRIADYFDVSLDCLVGRSDDPVRH